ASVAAAQEAETTRHGGIEEIVVTAQKREQDVREVPFSLLAISGDTLRDENVENLEDLAALAPNTEIQARPFGAAIYMRGLGSGTLAAGGNIGFEQSVGFFVDDVPLSRTASL